MKVPSFAEVKRELRNALSAQDRYTKDIAFQIELAAGARLAYLRLVADIEVLRNAVQRDGEDLDFVAVLDESIRALPQVQANYEKALVSLGLASPSVVEPAANKVGRPANPVVVDDATALKGLMKTVEGDINTEEYD